ncbi:MAG: type II CAAX endopeptidase family protein [bacterium]|nr:type II CAAX endopeptidase family protein [bacterium]
MNETKTLKGFKPPWGIYEVLIVLAVTILIPLAITFWLSFITNLGFLPKAVIQFLASDNILSSSLRVAFSLILEIGMLVWVLKRYKLNLGSMGFAKFKPFKALLLILSFYFLFAAVVLIVYGLVSWLFPSIDLNEPQKYVFEFGNKGVGLYLSFLVTVLIAPIIEETYFRGFIFTALSKRGGYLFGALASSFIFGLLHFQTNIIIYTFLLGLFLAFMYYRLKSIIPGIVLHTINNLVAFLIISKVI